MRIAVWNTAFLGDSVLTLPLIRTLKAAWPEAEVDFYVRGGLAALYEEQPEIARVHACDKRGKDKGPAAVLRQGRAVAERKYDIWVDAHLSLRSSFMAWASRAPVRVGYREACLSGLVFTKSVGRRFHELQEIERLLLLAGALGVPSSLLEDESLLWPKLVLPARAREDARELLASLPEGPTIGLHPGSVWPTKRWTPEGFAFILRRALESGINAVLLAGPGEEETAEQVRTLAGLSGKEAHFLDLSGRTSLPSLAAVLGMLDDYVTNDSGPMHLAWAQGTPVTALFGPTVRALGFAPRGAESSVLEVELPCRPCGLHGHKACPKGHFDCMKRIDPEVVWRDVEQKLAARNQE
ncbi:glycosyltransferase family 9 protein [Mailhella massiliensis]|uniref:glycosyltransferase family 9 protein n=1 Tax=Mailhella massiliensis TaxID=1903261 RepID=UPI0023F20F33|nr:glycosyltransferase family 9 protein [Mailhella massiliensis]